MAKFIYSFVSHLPLPDYFKTIKILTNVKETARISAILGQNVVKILKEATSVSVYLDSEKTTALVKVIVSHA